MTSKPTIHWRTEWANGTPTYIIAYSAVSDSQRQEIEQAAEREGFQIEGDHWHLPEPGPQISAIFEVVRARGYALDFEREDDDAPVNLERLKLDPETRHKLETMPNFTLGELAGYVPVQGQGDLDGLYWYFRARGSEWRFQVGGNENQTQAPVWWHGEEWRNDDAGYMTDQEAVTCILQSIERFRTEDRGRFEKGHPDYDRTMLDGWSYRAISLSEPQNALGSAGRKQSTERGLTGSKSRGSPIKRLPPLASRSPLFAASTGKPGSGLRSWTRRTSDE